MLPVILLTFSSLVAMPPQEEMKPMAPLAGMPSRGSARADWIRITNTRFQMSGNATRVAAEGDDGLTAVILVRGLAKEKQARKILQGKDEHALLFNSIRAEGFNRIVARNPETGEQWSAKLEQGKAVLEF